jgi:HSP20 family molecular chaperone IbpA
VLRFNVPGENKNTIKVSFDKNTLLITLKDNKPYSVTMNTESVNLDSCTAKCEDGILTLRFKELEKPKTKNITIE